MIEIQSRTTKMRIPFPKYVLVATLVVLVQSSTIFAFQSDLLEIMQEQYDELEQLDCDRMNKSVVMRCRPVFEACYRKFKFEARSRSSSAPCPPFFTHHQKAHLCLVQCPLECSAAGKTNRMVMQVPNSTTLRPKRFIRNFAKREICQRIPPLTRF